MASTPSATILPPGAGEAYWIVGDQITFKLGPEKTRGAFSFAETIVQPGGGPPPHVHGREDEMFYILDGNQRTVDLFADGTDAQSQAFGAAGSLRCPVGVALRSEQSLSRLL
jgi:hypothetical protein